MRLLHYFFGSAAALLMASGCTTAETGRCPMAAKPAACKPVVVEKAVTAPTATVAANYDKPGFVTAVVKGRLWVFAEGSEELAKYKASGNTPAECVSRPKAGPDRMTLLSPDKEVLEGYMVSKPGFVTAIVDGRLCVFAEGSEALTAFKASGKPPAEQVVRVKAGPLGMTLIGPDKETLDAYQK